MVVTNKDTVQLLEKTTFALGGRKYKLTNKRWGILAIVSIILLLDTFSASFFGFINDLSSMYFRVKPSSIDLLSTVNMIARSVFGIILAMAGEKLNFRMLTLITTSTIVAGDLLITAGVSSRHNFVVTVMGQVLNGVGATMSLTVTQMAPSNWFPAEERGRAVSLPWVTRRLSPVIANLVATRAIKLPAELVNATSEELAAQELGIVESFQITFQSAYLAVTFVALLSYALSYIYVTDYPPIVEGELEPPKEGAGEWRPWEEFKGILRLFTNGQYVLLFVMYLLVLSVRPMTEWLLSSVVLAAFPQLNDSYSGIMFAVGYTIGAFGPPTGGAILDRFRRPKLTFTIGASLVIAFCTLTSYSLYIKNFPLLFFAYVGMIFFRDFTFVCISHAFVESMASFSSSTKVRAFSISGSVPWFSLAVYTAVMRAVLDRIGAQWTVMIPIPFYVLGIGLYLGLYDPKKSAKL